MAIKRPSFLKRQKEMKRAARALEKREARRARRLEKPPATPDPQETVKEGEPHEVDADDKAGA